MEATNTSTDHDANAKEEEDLLTKDAREHAVSNAILKERFLLIILISVLIGATVVVSIAMIAFNEKIQSWHGNSFVVEFAQRAEQYETLKDQTRKEMEEFKEMVMSLESRLDNVGEIALLEMMIEHEKQNRLFIKKMIKAIHKLAIQVRGARTWYDQYSDKLDKLVNSSHLREKKLAAIKESHQPIYRLPTTLHPRNLDLGYF